MLFPQAVSLIRAFVQASASSTQGVPGSSGAVATGLGSRATAYSSLGVPWPWSGGREGSCSEIIPRHPTALRRLRRRHLGAPGTRQGGAERAPRPRWAAPPAAPPPFCRGAGVGFLQARSRLSVSVSPPLPGIVELGPPFSWEFCGRIGSAVTSQRAGPAAAMVAKDYPFYLTVKRANCSLEVPPASSPAKDAEVGTSLPGLLWVRLSVCLHFFLSRLPPCVTVSMFPSLTLCVPLFLSLTLCLLLSLSASCLPSLPSL